MEINIRELDEKTVKDIHQVDGTFTVDSKLNLHLENNILVYTIEDVPPFKKRYKQDDADYNTYIDDPDKTAYLAYIENQIVGQIILRKNWNNFAYIEDIAVDATFRGRGVGKTLLMYAKKWAREKKVAGIMLETQNNNVAACRLYEGSGLVLGGFDKYLYKELRKDTDEIALYWYYLLENDE
ncbi:MAG: GNAT family N-acetyltransferase [Theionarchaea archaeon]|nr:GNAT family N-acetyltransferase [Theionarchaea archaeon]